MDKCEIKRVFDQVKPTPEQEQAMLDRLFRAQKEVKPMSRMKKMTTVLVAAALLLMACAFTVTTGLDKRIMDFLGAGGEKEELLSSEAVEVNETVSNNGAEMTVKQILVDQYSLLVLAEFTVPEGMKLDPEEYVFQTTFYKFINEKGEPLAHFGYGSEWHMVEDQDPTDNTLEMICQIRSGSNRVMADLGIEDEYETTLDQQNITGLYLSVNSFLPKMEAGLKESYLAHADDIQQKLYYGKWEFSIPLQVQDSGWQIRNMETPVILGDKEAEIQNIYLSPLTLYVDISGVSKEAYYRETEKSGLTPLEQPMILRDRDGNELVVGGEFDMGSGDFIRESLAFNRRLDEIIDPEQYVGGTLTLFGQTFSLDGLAPAAD